MTVVIRITGGLPLTPNKTPKTVVLPRDAALKELRAGWLRFETRERLLPGTRVRLKITMEGGALPLDAPVDLCSIVGQEKGAPRYAVRLSFESLGEADRKLISLFIAKGRGSAQIAPAAPR